LFCAAEVLGRDIGAILVHRGEARLLLGRATGDIPKRILAAARRSIERNGMATAADVVAQLRNDGFDVSVELVTSVVTETGESRWLDPERNWFWFTRGGAESPFEPDRQNSRHRWGG
jgi:hypothetical protein